MIGKIGWIGLALVLVAQLIATLRVIVRLVTTSRGTRIAVATSRPVDASSVSVLVPVLNEEQRLAPCLAGLSGQPADVGEILVIDGGSTDGTRAIVETASRRDARIRWVDASPVPDDWNGKAWGLHTGFDHRDPRSEWVLTIDADVRPGKDLAPSLLAHARTARLAALSVATGQRLSGAAEAILHPALLATLVYRYGIPGTAVTDPEAVQANGQCFLVRADLLKRIGGFREGQRSISEDVTIAREVTRHGTPVGFFEPEQDARLIEVEMYASAREAWANWTRSLSMRDDRSGAGWWLRMADMTLTLGIPWPTLMATAVVMSRHKSGAMLPGLLCRLNAGLIVMRVGVTAGIRRAYRNPPHTYWLSILADPVVVVKLWSTAVQRQHMWRGRPIRRGTIRHNRRARRSGARAANAGKGNHAKVRDVHFHSGRSRTR